MHIKGQIECCFKSQAFLQILIDNTTLLLNLSIDTMY